MASRQQCLNVDTVNELRRFVFGRSACRSFAQGVIFACRSCHGLQPKLIPVANCLAARLSSPQPLTMASSSSRRSIGGGRILGSGKNLSPAAATAASNAALRSGTNNTPPSQAAQQRQQQSPAHSRNNSYLSQSESSLSLNSQTSTSRESPASGSTIGYGSGTEAGDLFSRVSLESADNTAAASASSRLFCPICNEDMVRSAHVETSEGELDCC